MLFGAFSLEDTKTRGFPCFAGKPAAVASLWGDSAPKYFTIWYVPCSCLAAWLVAELGTLVWDTLVPPVPLGPLQVLILENLGPLFWDALALAPFPGAAGVEVCSETKIIDLTRAGGGGPAHREVLGGCCFALLCNRELPNPSRRKKWDFFSGWALYLHMLGAPYHGATPKTLPAEMRRLIGACDVPPWVWKLPWGTWITFPLQAGTHPTYLPQFGGDAVGTQSFSICPPYQWERSSSHRHSSWMHRGHRGGCQATTPLPQGSRARHSRVPSKHAGAGWLLSSG